MEGHQTYLSFLPQAAEVSPIIWASVEKLVTGVALGLILLLAGGLAARRIKLAGTPDALIVPEERFSLFALFDLFIEAFVKFYDSIFGGHDGRRHLAFVASVFLFIFSANLLGLVPGVPAITTTVWVNVAIALVVFVYFNWQGVKTHGAIGYLKHFCGPLWWLAWFMFPLEIFSTCLRVLTLNLRLYWNITADHLVLGIFNNLLPPGLPVVFYVLGTFVCFMQAFIFTTLSMVYILLATQHEEEHHEE